MDYSYRYTDDADAPVLTCPACGHDWLAAGGVSIELTRGFTGTWEVDGRLDAAGALVDDSHGVASGWHSATLCGGCHEMLTNLDGVVEH